MFVNKKDSITIVIVVLLKTLSPFRKQPKENTSTGGFNQLDYVCKDCVRVINSTSDSKPTKFSVNLFFLKKAEEYRPAGLLCHNMNQSDGTITLVWIIWLQH